MNTSFKNAKKAFITINNQHKTIKSIYQTVNGQYKKIYPQIQLITFTITLPDDSINSDIYKEYSVELGTTWEQWLKTEEGINSGVSYISTDEHIQTDSWEKQGWYMIDNAGNYIFKNDIISSQDYTFLF